MNIPSVSSAGAVQSDERQDQERAERQAATARSGYPPSVPRQPAPVAREKSAASRYNTSTLVNARTATAGPTPAPAAPAAPAAPRGPLAGVTTKELDRLSSTYEPRPQPGGRPDTSTFANDTDNAHKIEKATELDMTGYPPTVARFEQRFSGMLDQLAALPPKQSSFYAASAATFDNAYRNASPTQRGVIEEKFGTFEDAVRREHDRSVNDPLERVMAVFNRPVGTGYLDKDGQFKVSLLAQMRNHFLSAATAQGRESVFKSAVALKQKLQAKIATSIDTQTAKQAADWKAANDDVDRMIKEADAITNDPGKRYELIARQLHTSNPGSGEDTFEDRRILAFTQRMQDDPNLHDKLAAWHSDAAGKLNGFGVSGAKRYEDVLGNLPSAGPDYVRDLADQYDAILKDSTEKDDSITPAARAKRVAGQIIEGTGRVLLGLTPFAPLTSVFDEHSALSPGARMGIDLTTGFLGMGLDPANAVGEAISGEKTFAQAVKEIDEVSGIGKVGAALGKTSSTGEASADEAARLVPIAPPVAHLDLQERLAGQAVPIPSDYAVAIKPESLKPASGDSALERGTLTGDGGQAYIKIGDSVYPVRREKDGQTWYAYDRDNPWRPSYPVSLNADNTWQVHSPLGLKGGTLDAGASTSSGMSNEMRTALDYKTWQSDANQYRSDPAYRKKYDDAFQKLSPQQQKMLKGWSAIEDDSDSDSGARGSSGTYNRNFDLNNDLSTNPNDPAVQKEAQTLDNALAALPEVPARNLHLIRTSDVPLDYAQKFRPGDLVTNSPRFMSASSDTSWATDTIEEGGSNAGTEMPAIAVYDITASSARPFMTGINTNVDHEAEWLFRPNTLFRVDEVAVLPPTVPGDKPRYGLRLTELPLRRPTTARNIHTGADVNIEPVYQTVEENGKTYTVLH